MILHVQTETVQDVKCVMITRYACILVKNFLRSWHQNVTISRQNDRHHKTIWMLRVVMLGTTTKGTSAMKS